MYIKHNIYIHYLCLMLFVSPAYAASFLDQVRKLFSINVSASILDSVNEDMAGSLRAKNIKFVIPNKVEMDDVEVLDERGERVLYGERVVLYLSLLSLLTKHITITNAHIEKPHFNYIIDKEVHNVVRVFESKKPSLGPKSDLRVTIAHVTTDNGTFEMKHDAGVIISASGISGEGKFFVEDGPFGVEMSRVSIRQGVIKVAGMVLPITNLRTDNLFISDTKVSSTGLNATYEKAALSGRGTVFIDKETYDIKATLDAPKGTYPQGLAPLPFVPPAFKATVSMAGALVDPDFIVSLDMGGTEFRGLALKQGQIRAEVNSHQILVQSANLKLGQAGELSSEGFIDIDHDKFSFNAKPSGITSEELSRFLSLKVKSSGKIFAQMSLLGNLPTKKETIFHLKTTGQIRDGAVDRLKFSPKTGFDVDLEFALDSAIHIHHALITDDLGLRLSARGKVDIKTNDHMIDYDLRAPSLRRYLTGLDKDLEANHYHVKGHLAIKDKTWLSSGSLESKSLSFEQYIARNLQLDFRVNNDEMSLSPITAQFFDGSLKGHITITDLQNAKKLLGKLNVEGVNLSRLEKSDVKLEGLVNAEINLAGTLDDPSISFMAEAEGLTLGKVLIRNSNVEGEYKNATFNIKEGLFIDKAGMLTGQNLSYNIKTKAISGDFLLSEASISLLLAQYFPHADGMVSGSIHVEGTLHSPQITAPLTARNIVIYGQKLGSGALSLALKNERLLDHKKVEDTVFSISSSLKQGDGESSFRIGWALNEKTLHSRIELSNLMVDASTLPFFETKVGFKGMLSGEVDAKGPLDRLTLSADGRVQDYIFFDPELSQEGAKTKSFGPADFNIMLNKGHLNLDLCASLADYLKAEQCIPKPGLSLSINGPFDFTSYDLNVRADIDHDHLENFFTPLRKELAIVSATVGLDGRIQKHKNREPLIRANLQLERLQASLPTIPSIELSHPINLSVTGNSITLNDQAILSFSPGLLALKGSVSAESIDVDVQGAMPLMLLRFFVPIIQRADGLAMGHIRVSGTALAPIFDGKIEPERGALVTFSKYLESLQFKAGQIVFRRTSKHSFTSDLSALRLGVGDGRLLINGVIDKHYPHKQKLGKTVFDVQVEGSNIVIKSGNQFIEGDFKLQTVKGENKEPTLAGNIIVTEGLAYRQFDLRNFVAQASQDTQAFSLKFLDSIPMKIDVEIAIRQFKAAARMLNINIETNLTGHLKAAGPLNHPKVTGSLNITEGKIIFPSVTFDLYESRIELAEDSDRVFDPKISLISSYELEKDLYPELARDTTIQLELKGTVDRLMLDLKPIRGDLKLSPTKIFLLLFMPQSLGRGTEGQLDVIKRRAQNAALAFSGEVFLRPITNELQEFLEGKTKTRIQFGSSLEPGGVTLSLAWKIGPRIEAQGSFMFMSDDNRPTPGKSSFMVDQYPLSDLKLRLLLFDHRPFGPLFFEGSFGANRLSDGDYETRSSLKLNYRVLSK